MANPPWNSPIREIRVQKTMFKAAQKVTVLVAWAWDT